MSISKSDLADTDLCKSVVRMYCVERLTKQQICKATRTTLSTVIEILNRNVDAALLERLKTDNYRKSKLGVRNPARGVRPRNFKGDCSDCKGYETRLFEGRRYFSHRLIFARALNLHIKKLPIGFDIHHIDGHKTNNDINNLALLTKSAHRRLHAVMKMSGKGNHTTPDASLGTNAPVSTQAAGRARPARLNPSVDETNTRTRVRTRAINPSLRAWKIGV